MTRRITAALLAALLPLGGAAAPLLHVHLDEHDTDHHRGRALHGHLAGHAAGHAAAADHQGGPVHVEESDDGRTVTPNLFVAVAPHGFELPAIATVHVRLAVPPERPARLVHRVTHGHDPPVLASLPPRAPPSRLS